MKSLKYFLVYFTPVILLFSILSRGIYTYTAVFVLFILVPVLELLFKGSKENLLSTEEEIEKNSLVYDMIIYSMVPIQFLLLYLFLDKISATDFQFYERAGLITAMGLSCGILGINVAHELGHRNTWYEQGMSKLLLMTSLYMHFFIEHNKGHHKHVSTDCDPASSRYGESVYAFYIRSITHSWVSAWGIEKERLERANQSAWSMQNELIQYLIVQVLFCSSIYIFFGVMTLFCFILAAVLGFHLLETVNYIQHYGLRRKKKNEEDYERTLPIHSWNSNASIGRILLFELTRHSDHHYMTTRKYQILRHFDESPQLPTGYPGMMLLSLIPPLWFKIVHRQIENYRKTEAGNSLA